MQNKFLKKDVQMYATDAPRQKTRVFKKDIWQRHNLYFSRLEKSLW